MHNQKGSDPPRLAQWLICRLTEYENEFSIEGDLREAYNTFIHRNGSRKSSSWYWSHVLKAVFPYFKYVLRRNIVMVKNYLKIALRNVMKHKGYSFLNVMGLTIGITCFTLIMLWVRDELNYDRYHEKADRIYG